MPPYYVITQNARLRVANRRLQVELELEGVTQVLDSVPLGQVSEVVLFGNVGLTTPAIDALLGQESSVVFLTRRGEYRGRLSGPLTPHMPLRRAQYQRLDSPIFALQMARGLVSAKLSHQRALLMRHNRECNDPLIAEAIARLAGALQKVPAKTQLSSLRGLEGAATAAYFSGYRRFFGPEWNFTDRNRRPPADPVNVLLSLGYTLLGQVATAAVETVGLDPYGGFFHETVYNRPSLALDLLEEFRPVIDGLVLWCCRSGQLGVADFSPGPPERPVVLGDEGLRRFIQAFEQRMDGRFTHPIRGEKLNLRQCLIEQARQAASRIFEDRPGWTGMGFH
ncbi:CRISPR-associated protein, Cas1 family [Anaerolinea thermolimosa]|uniref:CRISPR-associated endonuclease Cas1 n=1 Tax=Anaerolinea thermolimosa TaxID=229919 RepID=UPI000780E2F8|nr:CRISPR-associated endonuclease Cas1 [Anaerolinea thermolimosa]GAP05382.1 CRISPR-associated protein, Cas1 family [Anaerolinea thermolimosa]